MSGAGKWLKITKVEAAPLFGDTPKGGWDSEIQPGDSLHAIVAVHTDGGIIGYGSAYTDGRLVQTALKVLERFYLGENALEPERVTEKMHQNTFWMGRGGTLTHAISGIDIALWDILGKALGVPVAQLLGGFYRRRAQPYCSLLMEEPGPMRDLVAELPREGFSRLQDRLGTVRAARRPEAGRGDRARRRGRARATMRSCSSMPAPPTPIGRTG